MTRTGRKSNDWDNDEKDNYDGGDGGGDDGGGVLFERAEAKRQSLRMLRYLTATLIRFHRLRYRGATCTPNRGRKPATATAVAGNTDSATANT